MLDFFFAKTPKITTDFSNFVREASSAEKKKVFMDVLKHSTEDQRKILNQAN